jgi:hypothetical protein
MCPVTNSIVTPKAQMSGEKDRSSQPLRHSGAVYFGVPPLLGLAEEAARPKSHRTAPRLSRPKMILAVDIVVEDPFSLDAGFAVQI